MDGGYWINPSLGLKICLRLGNVFFCGKMVGNYFDLWLIHSKLSWSKVPHARETLRAWIEAQKLKPESAHAIPLFTEDPAELDRIFYVLLFQWGLEFKYRGTAKKLWETFRDIHGPVRTRNLIDFSSYKFLHKFLRYRLEHPSRWFSLEKVSGPKRKEEIFEVKDASFLRPGGFR